MYSDVPRFNRCCFCLPLRYSLLVWGCFILGFCLFHIYNMADMLHFIVDRTNSTTNDEYVEIKTFITVVCVSGLVTRSLYVFVCIALIIATLKKHVKLFCFVYYCSIADLVFLFVFGLYILSMTIHIQVSVMPMSSHYILRNAVRDIIMVGGTMFFEGYAVLLVRSELLKLRERSKIQFTNAAAEAKVVVDTLEQI